MAFKFENEKRSGTLVKPGERLFLDSDQKRLLKAGHPDARYLFCTEHQSVPADSLEAFDRSDLKPKKTAAKRAKVKAEDKSALKGEDKAGDSDG